MIFLTNVSLTIPFYLNYKYGSFGTFHIFFLKRFYKSKFILIYRCLNRAFTDSEAVEIYFGTGLFSLLLQLLLSYWYLYYLLHLILFSCNYNILLMDKPDMFLTFFFPFFFFSICYLLNSSIFTT